MYTVGGQRSLLERELVSLGIKNKIIIQVEIRGYVSSLVNTDWTDLGQLLFHACCEIQGG